MNFLCGWTVLKHYENSTDGQCNKKGTFGIPSGVGLVILLTKLVLLREQFAFGMFL